MIGAFTGCINKKREKNKREEKERWSGEKKGEERREKGKKKKKGDEMRERRR